MQHQAFSTAVAMHLHDGEAHDCSHNMLGVLLNDKRSTKSNLSRRLVIPGGCMQAAAGGLFMQVSRPYLHCPGLTFLSEMHLVCCRGYMLHMSALSSYLLVVRETPWLGLWPASCERLYTFRPSLIVKALKLNPRQELPEIAGMDKGSAHGKKVTCLPLQRLDIRNSRIWTRRSVNCPHHLALLTRQPFSVYYLVLL